MRQIALLTSVKRTDLQPVVEYQVVEQALSGDGYGVWSNTKTVSSEEREQRREPDSAPAKLHRSLCHWSVPTTG